MFKGGVPAIFLETARHTGSRVASRASQTTKTSEPGWASSGYGETERGLTGPFCMSADADRDRESDLHFVPTPVPTACTKANLGNSIYLFNISMLNSHPEKNGENSILSHSTT